MTDQEIRSYIARNIAWYRKHAGHTQTDLADKINYSDKSISKWERGDGVPDIYVMQRIAELYGITVNDLLAKDEPRIPRKKKNKHIVILMACSLTFLTAMVIFFALHLIDPQLPRTWLAFIYALPICSILGIVFANLWYSLWMQMIPESLLIWSVAVCIHLTLTLPGAALIYIIGAILQVLLLLWHIFRARQIYNSQNP